MAFRSRKRTIAQSAADAVRIAKKIGFPVVAKVVSADILHKSDIGGVVLNLNSPAEVTKAFNDITARVKKLKSRPKLEGILIAQQVKADLNSWWAPSLDGRDGAGGAVRHRRRRYRTAEGCSTGRRDRSTRTEARALIGRTKAGVKMKGYRGKPGAARAVRRQGAGRPVPT